MAPKCAPGFVVRQLLAAATALALGAVLAIAPGGLRAAEAATAATTAPTTPTGSVADISVAVSPTTAVNASGVSYTVGFTTSAGGALTSQGSISLTAPPGTLFNDPVTITDQTTGVSFGSAEYSGNVNAITIGITGLGTAQINGGDKVTVTIPDVTNDASTGPQAMTVSTSSDQAATNTHAYTLTPEGTVTGITAVPVTPTTAVNASGVVYTVGFTTSAGGALTSQGSISLTAPPGTLFNDPVTITDLTTGVSFGSAEYSGNVNAITIGITGLGTAQINGGDKVTVTIPDVTNDASTGPQAMTVSTSSDQAATNTHAYTLTPEGTVGDVTVTPSLTAAGATGVSYAIGFTTSAGGALGSQGSISLTAPPGTLFNDPVTITDLTTGLSFGSAEYSGNVNAITIGITGLGTAQINGGDKVVVTVPNVTSVTSLAKLSLKVSTSSDKPAAGTFTLTPPTQVAAPAVTISTQAPGGQATYTATFTASATGAMAADLGEITLAGPAGTVFGPAVAYTVDDLTEGQTSASSGTASNNGATATIGVPFAIGAGDQVSVTAAGVTNPPAPGHVAMDISTGSDPAPATTPQYILGDSPPIFTAASPPLAVAPGSGQQYTFVTTGFPAAVYSLSGAPAWLTINSATGQLAGKVPAGTKSFGYSVKAANSSDTATEGPYQVAVGAGAIIGGHVTDPSGNPVTNVEVDACDATGGACESATTSDTGAFSLSALAGSTVVITAWPPPGSGVTTASIGPVKVSASGLSDQTIIVQAGIPPLQGHLLINGSAAPVVFWASPATATLTGCPDGLATVTVIGQNISTGDYDPDVIVLTETPAGSGFYTGTIPPQEPVHGPVDIRSSLLCPELSQLQPDAGPASGGSTVIIGGTGLASVTSVRFGATPAASYSVLSDDAIQAVAPPGAGTVPVTVTQAGSTASDTIGQFTYEAVKSAAPDHGPQAGGTWVVIKGDGLLTTSRVLFGPTAAQDYVVLSDTEIEALSPAGKGTADITVETGDGTTDAVPGDKFTYGTGTTGGRSAVAAPAAKVMARSPLGPQVPTLSPQAPATTVVGLVTQFIYSKGADIVGASGSLGKIKAEIQELLANQPRSCKQSEQDTERFIMLALDPLIGAISEALAPTVAEAMIPFFLSLGLVGIAVGVVIVALTPILLNQFIDFLAEQLVSAAVDAYFDKLYSANCGNPEPPPPPPLNPPPPPPGSQQICSFNCGFNPTGRIDPSGTVLTTNGQPVKGATVTILRSFTKNGAYLAVTSSSPVIFPAENPEITSSNGAFHWEVFPGWYKVKASAPGCTVPGSKATTAVIGPYPVPPPQLGLTITLRCAGQKPRSAPSVTGLSLAAGPPAGGSVISVLGANFTPGSKVRFGATAAKSVTYLSPQALTVVAPKGAGLENVQVTTAGGTSAKVASDRFFFGSAPKVAKVRPSAGPASGGTTVTITGSGFTGATAVSFGSIAAKRFTVKSATTITAITARGTAGSADIQVSNPAGLSAAGGASKFSYLAPVTAYIATKAGVVPLAEGAARAGSVIRMPGAAALAATPDGDKVLVAGSHGATEIGTASGRAGGTVPTGKAPAAIAMTPNGGTAYILNSGSDSVTPITVSTGLARKNIPVGSDPDAIAITPGGAVAYVADAGSGTVTPITLATGKTRPVIKVGTHPGAIAILPDGKTAYVLNSGSGTVTPIAVATGKAGRAITVGKEPSAIVITPDGATAYVVNSGSGTVTPISTSTGEARKAIKVGKDPDFIVLTPDGKTAYVLNRASDTVTPVSVPGGKAGRAIKVGKSPVAAAVTPDGTRVYVLNSGSGTLTPISVKAGAAGQAIAVGSLPVAITITR